MNKNLSKKQTVFIGMSGGVDSSVSAALLKDEGFDVVGVFIRTWHPDFIQCNEEEEKRDAIRVCAHLNIPFLELDLESVYKKEVADYMIDEYKKGRTPNPDVLCNSEVKFGAFMSWALEKGADFVATGHYARVGCPTPDTRVSNTRQLQLTKAKDSSKDQSYFLYKLTQKQLEKIIFPIGHLKKTQVRILAKKFNLPVAEKKDSQGICFLGDIDLKDFLKHYIKEKKGNVVLAPHSQGEVGNEKNEIIGEHNGVFFSTLGERHGFTVIKKGSNDKPYYVVSKDVEKNILYVSQDKKNNELNNKKQWELMDINLINSEIEIGKNYTAQIRYHGEFLPCTISISRRNLDMVEVVFAKPISVAGGQSVVIYDKDKVLGGGIVV